MTKQEALELFAQHHPDMGEKEALRIINKAIDTFSEETDIVQESFYETTAANQRYYDLPAGIIEINRVTLSDGDGKDYSIPRSSTPSIEDTDLT